MKRINNIAFCIMVLGIWACAPTPRPPVRAFYYWKTNLSISQEERAYLDHLGVSKLYVKFFDVDWHEGPVPLAEVFIDTQRLAQLHIVPCIFITNRCMAQLPEAAVPELAGRILQKIEELAGQYPGLSIHEIQADCDWTPSTRERYFALLDLMRNNLAAKGILLSATVRLHQYRRPEQTGTPPVDRGMLMCYNVGDLENWDEENSILRATEARKYFVGAQAYPIPLDVVLPVFRWGVLFRNDRMIRLIHGLGPESLADTARFRPLGPDRFEVVKSTYLDGHYLYEDDLLRIETPDSADLQQSARLLRGILRRSEKEHTAAFYHLDTATIRHFPVEMLEVFFREMD